MHPVRRVHIPVHLVYAVADAQDDAAVLVPTEVPERTLELGQVVLVRLEGPCGQELL